MRQVTRKGLMTVAAASGVLAAAGGYAHADSGAQGSATNSPGVLSGNTVQAPVEAEVNVCGNTVNVVGLLNPAAGNKCSNGGGGGKHGGGSGSSHGGSQAHGHTGDSPGVASGNTVQAPVNVPVNACGNSVNVIGVGNTAMGNDCSNGGGGGHHGGGSGSSYGGSHADGHASNSPGVASGNHVQAPVDVPVNVCGNTISVVGIGNGVTGNDCGNSGGGGAHENPGGGHQNPPGDSEEASPQQPGKPGQPGGPGQPGNPGGEVPGGDTNTPGTQTVTQPDGVAQLAQTGAEVPLGLALSVGAGTLLGGALIYRKARAAAL
ncbi:chaplin [Streptomyces sp. CA-210063]|uniref:chaplin n=1 Tax=Streptomyces sp. CA-210063 TaxID=2801029 RepID=UPI0027D456FF|nr:chaplin [Streptomyces sp. CA-210063]